MDPVADGFYRFIAAISGLKVKKSRFQKVEDPLFQLSRRIVRESYSDHGIYFVSCLKDPPQHHYRDGICFSRSRGGFDKIFIRKGYR